MAQSDTDRDDAWDDGSEPASRGGTPMRLLAIPAGGGSRPGGSDPGEEARGETRAPPHLGRVRPLAGFVTQLILSVDPGLRPSRAVRSRTASERYVAAARLIA